MRALRILVGYLACACIFLSASGRAGPTEEAEIVQGTAGSGSAETETAKSGIVPRASLGISVVWWARTRYLRKCDKLADLDISTECYAGKRKTIEYGNIVVYIPHDLEYLKRLRRDNTLTNSISSLVSSGMFGKSSSGRESMLDIRIDANDGALLDTYGNGNGIEYYSSSRSLGKHLVSDLVGPLCERGRKGGISINQLLDTAIKKVDKDRQSEFKYLYYVDLRTVPRSRNDVLMDFIYLYELERSGGKIPKGAGGLLPISIENSAVRINQDNFRALSLYMRHASGSTNSTSAALYVPHFDGNDHDKAINSFFSVVELLRNHEVFPRFVRKGATPNGASVFDARRRRCGIAVKVDIDAHISDDNPFRTFYKFAWGNNLKPGGELIAPSRSMAYNVGEGFGGFVLVVPFSNEHFRND